MRLIGEKACAAVLLVLLLASAGLVRAQESPSKSVFQLIVMYHDFDHYSGVVSGTAFFISSDGTALTNSHIVRNVVTEPRRYVLLAIIRDQFYGATVVCASPLPVHASDGTVTWSRDVAEVRVTAHPPFMHEITYHDVIFARPHIGPLPSFPALRMGNDPSSGDHVRILGFGSMVSPVPYEWSASGTVMELEKAEDGTPVFAMQYDRSAAPGHSGSPVLNDRDEVVGLEAWGKKNDSRWGGAIAVSALNPICP